MAMTPEALQRAVDNVKHRPHMRLHNVELVAAVGDPAQLTIRVDGAEISVWGNGNASAFAGNVGMVGSIASQWGNGDLEGYRFVFRAYLDQSLRRAPELDVPSSDGCRVEWGWICDARPSGMLVPFGFEPGENGEWIPDETKNIEVPIPPEFAALCNEIGMSPLEVLRGFIADVCSINNYVAAPRADGFCSNGSDERDMANDYFERAYGWMREHHAKVLLQAEKAADESRRRENLLEQVDLALDDYLDAGGNYADFLASIEELKPR